MQELDTLCGGGFGLQPRAEACESQPRRARSLQPRRQERRERAGAGAEAQLHLSGLWDRTSLGLPLSEEGWEPQRV